MRGNGGGIALRQLGVEKFIDVPARSHQGFSIAPGNEDDRRGRAGGLDCAGHRQRVHDVAQIAGLCQSDTVTGIKFRLPRPPMPAPGVLALPRTYHLSQVCNSE